MMARKIQAALLGLILGGAPAVGESFTLVNTLSTRPVFSLEAQGSTQTRSLAPGQKVSLPPGRFSGLGENKTPVLPGSVYYLARFGTTAGLYALAPDQVLILNQSGRAVFLRLTGQQSVEGLMADGALALGATGKTGSLTTDWTSASQTKTQALEPGRVYRLVLDSPQGVGTEVSLIPWD